MSPVAGSLIYAIVTFCTMLLVPGATGMVGRVAPAIAPATDSAALHAGLVLSISEFQIAWQQAWQAAERARITSQGSGLADVRRVSLVHCHPDGKLDGALPAEKTVGDFMRRASASNQMIQSRTSWYAVCPSWLLDDTMDAQDAPGGRDGPLPASTRRRIVELRSRLITTLRAASTEQPTDGWIAGQLVRFELDRGDVDAALAAAQTCGAAAWWCDALTGYVRTRRSERAQAESLFVRMDASMPATQRCRWNSVAVFAAGDEQKAYNALPCARQAEWNARFWWLADPMFRERGNERWVEQQARRVETAIRGSLAQDEWHPWAEKYGGDALEALTLRYGMPSHFTWFGDTLDLSHTRGYLEKRGTVGSPPYTTFEYAANRIHTVPTWSTVLAPFAATASNWDLATRDATTGAIAADWWPTEHFKPARFVVQFPETQVALFRRQSQSIVAAAADTREAALPANALFDVLMLSSTGPTQLDSLAQVAMKVGPALTMRAPIPVTPTLISIEGLGANGTTFNVRTRFGVVPPPPLDSMHAGDLEISDIALLDTRGDAVAITEPDEALLDHMAGTLHLDAAHRRIGLYWESYGASATDTVSVSVRVGTIIEVTALQRVGMALRISDDPNRSITLRWSEPQANRGARTLEGPIPVQQRTLALDLSQLPPGDYALEITMQRPRGKAVSSTRRFTIDP